jgi:hypothetical protein
MLEKVVLDLSSKSKVLANLCDCCHKNRVLLRLVNRCSSASKNCKGNPEKEVAPAEEDELLFRSDNGGSTCREERLLKTG